MLQRREREGKVLECSWHIQEKESNETTENSEVDRAPVDHVDPGLVSSLELFGCAGSFPRRAGGRNECLDTTATVWRSCLGSCYQPQDPNHRVCQYRTWHLPFHRQRRHMDGGEHQPCESVRSFS